MTDRLFLTPESDAERARFLRDLSSLVAAHVADIHDHVGEELDDDAGDDVAIAIGPNTILSGDGKVINHAGENYYRRDEPETVSTRAEFDALPAGTVVRRDSTGPGDDTVVAERRDVNNPLTGDGMWWRVGPGDPTVGSQSLVNDRVPYTVLHRPGGAS